MTEASASLPAYHSPGGVDGRLDWETPPELFDVMHGRYRFVKDLAAHEGNAKLPDYFTETDDALRQPWPEGACWLNPPYGGSMGAWVEKAIREAKTGTTTVMLVPVRSSTTWWHRVLPLSERVVFLKGRITFVGAEHPAPFPTCLIVVSPFGGPPVLECADLPRGAVRVSKGQLSLWGNE